MKINFLCSTSFHEMTKEFQFLDTSGPPKSESDTQDHARSAFLMKTNGSKRPKFHKNRIKRGQFKKKLSFYFLHIYKIMIQALIITFYQSKKLISCDFAGDILFPVVLQVPKTQFIYHFMEWSGVGKLQFCYLKNMKFTKTSNWSLKNYLVTIGNFFYQKIIKSDTYFKFLKINFFLVVKHSAYAHIHCNESRNRPSICLTGFLQSLTPSIVYTHI